MEVYDLRQKKVIHTIDTGSNEPVHSISFQAPKWATTSALKETIVDAKAVPKQIPLIPEHITSSVSSSKQASVMDMFSPINKSTCRSTHR